MARILINQLVDVHSYPPDAKQSDGEVAGDEHVHDFINLIPACEFALSLAKEGHLNMSLQTEYGGTVNLAQAQLMSMPGPRVKWRRTRKRLKSTPIDAFVGRTETLTTY